METKSKIEAVLFYRGEPMRLSELSKLLSLSEEEIKKALSELSSDLKDRGVCAVMLNEYAEMRVAPEASALIQESRKEELSRDLGKAGSETLSILLYRGPSTRAEIDFIRGVNSTFILRNLLIRGLVERTQGQQGGRGYLYKPTVDLLSHLGITKIEELPEYKKIREELSVFEGEDEKTNNLSPQ